MKPTETLDVLMMREVDRLDGEVKRTLCALLKWTRRSDSVDLCLVRLARRALLVQRVLGWRKQVGRWKTGVQKKWGLDKVTLREASAAEASHFALRSYRIGRYKSKCWCSTAH